MNNVYQIQQLMKQLADAEARHAQQLSLIAQEENRASAQIQQIINDISQISLQQNQANVYGTNFGAPQTSGAYGYQYGQGQNQNWAGGTSGQSGAGGAGTGYFPPVSQQIGNPNQQR